LVHEKRKGMYTIRVGIKFFEVKGKNMAKFGQAGKKNEKD